MLLPPISPFLSLDANDCDFASGKIVRINDMNSAAEVVVDPLLAFTIGADEEIRTILPDSKISHFCMTLEIADFCEVTPTGGTSGAVTPHRGSREGAILTRGPCTFVSSGASPILGGLHHTPESSFQKGQRLNDFDMSSAS
jgi:hypothetical protein